jgi:hypothetical protein
MDNIAAARCMPLDTLKFNQLPSSNNIFKGRIRENMMRQKLSVPQLIA